MCSPPVWPKQEGICNLGRRTCREPCVWARVKLGCFLNRPAKRAESSFEVNTQPIGTPVVALDAPRCRASNEPLRPRLRAGNSEILSRNQSSVVETTDLLFGKVNTFSTVGPERHRFNNDALLFWIWLIGRRATACKLHNLVLFEARAGQHAVNSTGSKGAALHV